MVRRARWQSALHEQAVTRTDVVHVGEKKQLLRPEKHLQAGAIVDRGQVTKINQTGHAVELELVHAALPIGDSVDAAVGRPDKRICAKVAPELIIARPPNEAIISCFADQKVVTGFPGKRVVTGTAPKVIGPPSAGHMIVATAQVGPHGGRHPGAVNVVIAADVIPDVLDVTRRHVEGKARAPLDVDRIEAVAAVDQGVRTVDVKAIVAASAGQAVGTCFPDDRIVAVATNDGVIAAAGKDQIVTPAPRHRVIAGSAVYLEIDTDAGAIDHVAAAGKVSHPLQVGG